MRRVFFFWIWISCVTVQAAVMTQEVAIFAGGCFWCMEAPFDTLKGVQSTIVGYTGGTTENPTYPDVSSGKTGHAEAVQITYNADVISYDQLLDVFWRNIDPTTLNQQFADVGTPYRTAIYYLNEDQKRKAERSRDALAKSGKFKNQIVTEITAAGPFYPAEDYHQDYYQKNPIRYKVYRYSSGRDSYLKSVWDQP